MEKATAHLELVKRYFTDFSPVQLQQLTALEELYKDWNTRINVISRKDIDSLYEKHVLHSLAIAAAFEFTKGMEVIDIGTGGGFPGVPLAIFFPEVQFHLVDSIGKKLKVIEAVKEATGLLNITTQHGRAEEIKNRKFDTAVSRAVAPLKDLWTWAKPLLRKTKTQALRSQQPRSPGQALHMGSGTSSRSGASHPTSGEPTTGHSPASGHQAGKTPYPGSGHPATGQSEHQKPSHPSAPGQPGPHNLENDPSRSAQQTSQLPGAPDPETPLPIPNGLICLKGGDLASEISESGCRPRIMEIHEIFQEEYFHEKYLLYVPL